MRRFTRCLDIGGLVKAVRAQTSIIINSDNHPSCGPIIHTTNGSTDSKYGGHNEDRVVLGLRSAKSDEPNGVYGIWVKTMQFCVIGYCALTKESLAIRNEIRERTPHTIHPECPIGNSHLINTLCTTPEDIL